MRRVAVFLSLLLCVLPASAQNPGSLTGKVVSEAGEGLFGANIVVKGPAIAALRGTTSDDRGMYQVDGLPAGEYEVTVSFLGYETVTAARVAIRAGERTVRDFSLAASALVGQQVVVSASRKQEKALDAPASVEVVEMKDIRDSQALSVDEHIKTLSGVDHAKTGIVQASTVIRGFNKVLSGLLLTMVDNRLARIPSLRINSFHIIPITSEDIERIEIVRGPGSALYGPNSSNGVMHIISRSPFGSEGNFVSLSGGERNLRKASFRHASSVNDMIGLKISGKYLKARDWEHHDPAEVVPRNLDVGGQYGEIRVDVRPSEELTFIGSAGYSKSSSIQMTGQGSAQGRDWVYGYLQGRMLYKGWFGQFFYNKSDAGATQLLRTGDDVVDKSSLTVMQLQNTSDIGRRQQFVYGVDLLLTRPRTEGTIHGAYEDDDDTDEYGVYLQSETRFTDQVSLMLAGRLDRHSRLDNPVFSPRAAVVMKPSPENTFRVTYNRAFNTPTVTTLSLDIRAVTDAFGFGGLFGGLGLGPDNTIDIRSYGARNPFTFRRDETGRPMYRSPFATVAGLSRDTYLRLDDPAANDMLWSAARELVVEELITQLGNDSGGLVTPELAAQFTGVIPENLHGLTNSLRLLNPETQDFDPYDVSAVQDIDKIRPTITQTLEFGYKGIVRNKLVLAADFYRTQMNDYTLPLWIFTPSVFIDEASLRSALSQGIADYLADPANVQLATLIRFLDTAAFGGNGNGDYRDEVDRYIAQIAEGTAMIPFGTITPERASDPTAVALTYRNFGDVTVYGADLGFSWFPTRSWHITGSYSYIHRNLFENVENLGDVPLNSPKHKFSGGVTFRPSSMPLTLGGKVSYRGSFPMLDGVYAGPVDSYAVVDANAAYEFSAITFSVEAGNLLNTKYRAFVGAPEIGRLLSAGVAVRF
ncbi:MAG: TonB-dependent receptor [Gemmatimonadetes bacterium]|nr:TonB-dependent receptor [Gemmatimonadota bacterium]